MKNILFAISTLWCTILCAQKTTERMVDCNEIKTNHNLFYYGNEKAPYSGKCDLFYQKGKKSDEVSFKEGKYDGPRIHFYEYNGQRSREANYKEGIFDSSYTSWYLNGKKKTTFAFKAGKPSGDFIKWDYRGNKIFQKYYSPKNQKEDGTIAISSEQDVIAKRRRLIKHIWGVDDLPTTRSIDSIETNIVFTTKDGKTPYMTLYNTSGNLKQIDRCKVFMSNSYVSNVYHFRPIKSINKVFFYHSGHSRDFQFEDCKSNNDGVEPGLVIPRLLKEGYDVFAFMMPVEGNNMPSVELDDNIGKISFPPGVDVHDLMFDYLEHPYTYFLEPMLATVNYLEKNYRFNAIYLMGLSGGGWATTLYAALDPRIKCSFPVAGSMPTYLRRGGDTGDGEQGYYPEYDPDGLYNIANYEELYVLGSYGKNRQQIQILNEFDDCCFAGKRYPSWIDDVKAVVDKLAKGRYDFYLEQNTKTHKVSKITMDVILSSLKGCRLELIDHPSVKAIAGTEYYFKPLIKSTKACKPVKNMIHSLIMSPSWLSVDSLSGVLSGKPSPANIGDTLYSFKTIDGYGGFIIKDVRLRISK